MLSILYIQWNPSITDTTGINDFVLYSRDTAKPGLWTLDWTMDWTMDWTDDDHYQSITRQLNVDLSKYDYW